MFFRQSKNFFKKFAMTENNTEEYKTLGSARVAKQSYYKLKSFLDRKSRKWSWFVRGILLFDEKQLQELYDQIEQEYESQAN